MKRKLLFTIFAVLGLSSFVIAQDNLLANYQFDDIDDPIWDLNNNSGGDGVLVYDEFGELSGEYCASIEVNGTGDNNYNIQLVQYGIPVENGVTYYLSFMAKVEDVFNLAFSWEENGGSWTRYGTTSFILEPEITKYQYEFVSTGTDETANFKFFFGDQANVGLTVKLDSIVLSEDEFVYGEPTSVKQRSSNTDQLKVYPNPAKNDFTVSYNLASQQAISIDLFNIAGQKEVSLISENQSAGTYNKRFETNNLKSGVYFIRLTSKEQSVVKKLIVE